jgi:hypothetical protein
VNMPACENLPQELIAAIADNIRDDKKSLRTLSNFAWHSLSPNQRSAFLRRFESIIALELSLHKKDTSNDIPTIICSFPHLRKLVLVPSFQKLALPGPSPLSPELRLPERLSTLRVSDFYQDYRLVLEWLCSIPERLPIHTLHIATEGLLLQDVDTINTFLKALGPSLEVFGYDSDCMSIPCAPSVELFYISRL